MSENNNGGPGRFRDRLTSEAEKDKQSIEDSLAGSGGLAVTGVVALLALGFIAYVVWGFFV